MANAVSDSPALARRKTYVDLRQAACRKLLADRILLDVTNRKSE
jgi:hypothetical protein